ncbi:MAG: penicillin-binding protein, partial [Erysipelotrichaceae bacterium]|nr:penicillin-binding protein [Erysipelotrichaceae bacterium]
PLEPVLREAGLATIFGLLTQDLYQTELGIKGRNLPIEVVDQIRSYELNGVEFTKSVKRNYYIENFAPYLVGFAQTNDEGVLSGKMGVESYLDEYLSGTDGKIIYQVDKNGYILPGMRQEKEAAINGNDVYLTIDESIQNALNDAINSTLNEYNANAVWGSVMEIETGKILAYAQYPSFDPNKMNIETYLNYGSQYCYEPGSVFKSIIYAAAIESGKYDGQSTFNSAQYCYLSDSNGNPYRTYDGNGYGCIHNAENKEWGYITFDQGLVYSSNVATSTLLSDVVGSRMFLDYVEKFGFMNKVDTDGIAENVGTYNFDWAAEKLAMTFGQGISVNMLQIMQAYSAIFGDGTMVKPYFIEKIVDSYDNSVIYQHQRQVAGNPISETTARHLQKLLRNVIKDGGLYEIPEIELMGKTGTAQRVNENGYYDPDNVITSVIFAFPAEHPKYMVYYAFDCIYNYYNHVRNYPVRDFMARISKLLESDEVKINTNSELLEIKEYEMPEMVNHSVDYAKEVLSEYNTDLYILGDGDTIIAQYPQYRDKVYTKEKVFLLTDSSFFKMPNLYGWSRKELLAFWKITGMETSIEGTGLAYYQSINPGEAVDNSYVLSVKLSIDPEKEE